MSKSYFSSGSKHNSSQDDSDDDIMSFEEFEKMISEYGPDSSEDKTSENTANKPNKDVAKENDVKVHYNSPEPEKFGAKAFTKDGEVYLAPGEEDSLKHELVHVYQQKNKSIPITGKINGQKINTDPKLEKEADKGVENINIAERTKEEAIQTQDVIQFDKPTEENVRDVAKRNKIPLCLITQENINEIMGKLNDGSKDEDILKEWKTIDKVLHSDDDDVVNYVKDKGDELEIPESLLSAVIEKFLDQSENSDVFYFGTDYVDNELKKVKEILDTARNKEININCLTAEDIGNILEKIDKKCWWSSRSTVINKELDLLLDTDLNSGLDSDLITQIIFDSKDEETGLPIPGYGTDKTLIEALKMLDKHQFTKTKDCILKLKEFCDNKGIASVIKGANQNVTRRDTMLIFDNDKYYDKTKKIFQIVLLKD